MNVLRRGWAIFVVAAKRLFSQRWLALATAVGLVAAVALAMSIPLYADAVYYRVLQEELAGVSSTRRAHQSPFVYVFQYMGGWSDAMEWSEVQPADAYLSGQAGPALGLPQQLAVRFFKSDNFGLFPEEDVAYTDFGHPLTWVSFAFASEFEDHVTILEGGFPAVADLAPDGPIEVLVSEALATELGVQVGETYTAFAGRETDEGQQTLQIPIRIAGVWRATDPEEAYWFYKPEALKEEMIVAEETFTGRISSAMDDEVYLGVWYLVMDGSGVYAGDVEPLLSRTRAVEQQVSSLLPNARLFVSPEGALQNYRRAVNLLTILLCAFGIPIVSLIAVFIGLVVGLAVDRKRSEIAILRSRGSTVTQVVGIAILEGLLLGAVALLVGLPLGQAIARAIGKTRSFLDFTLQADLRVGVPAAAMTFGLAMAGLALVAQVLPTIGAARHTIVTYKQEQARSLRAPWWQRFGLDILLLIPAAYGVHLLRQRGNIALPGLEEGAANDPFQDPLLFLVPALGAFALSLFVVRALPPVISAVAWVSSHTGSVGTLLAARHLSRARGFYTAPLMLLVLTLSLSTFTASLAQTLDAHLHDQMYYWVGADMRLEELGEDTQTGRAIIQAMGGEVDEDEAGPRWLFLPVSEYLKVPGVEAATRVARCKASSHIGRSVQTGRFVGIERVDFARVAFWRRDFAPANLGALMNELALHRDGVLVPREFMAQHALDVGDLFRLVVDVPAQHQEMHLQRVEVDVRVVGGFDRFPTWYEEEDGPLFVGNLDYLFEKAGGQFPYQVWLNTEPGTDYEQVAESARDLRLRVVGWRSAPFEVTREQRRPERQGLFGLLSVGFLAAALLTVLGFLLYAFFSFRRRFIELGILRAIGLSAAQMTIFLAWELAFLILTGVLTGTGLGVLGSRALIPYLQADVGLAAGSLPVAVEIAWAAVLRIYVLFGLLFVVALGGLATLLMRMKIFQAVKLGETT